MSFDVLTGCIFHMLQVGRLGDSPSFGGSGDLLGQETAGPRSHRLTPAAGSLKQLAETHSAVIAFLNR